MKYNILIIEDSPVFAKGLRMLLLQKESIGNVFTALNYEGGIKFLDDEDISFVILDIQFRVSNYDGFSIAENIRTNYSKIKIMILSDYALTDYYTQMFENQSVKAYLDKQSDEDNIYKGIDALINGQQFLCPKMEKLKGIGKSMIFTKREDEIISLLVKGITQAKIAEQLFISPKTVERHIENLRKKFKVNNTAELVAKYVEYRNSNDEDIDGCTPPFKKI